MTPHLNSLSPLMCPQCAGGLKINNKASVLCSSCCSSYPITDHGIVLLQEDKYVDLRMGNEIDYHDLRANRHLNGEYIKSDVEAYGRIHSINFTHFHADLLSPYTQDAIIVDLGGGQVPSINVFPDDIKIYFNLDLGEKSLQTASKWFNRQFPLILLQHNASYQLPFPENSIDIVISSEVIEHLDNPMEHLKEAYRICKPGGYLSLSTPCVSMYLYPHNFVKFFKGYERVKLWYKRCNAHLCWDEALSWHPALRPKILREWVESVGFTVERHETRLWYFHTPAKLIWRFLGFLERNNVSLAGDAFQQYLKFTDYILTSNIPVLKWAGTRQFIFCRKE